MRSNNLSRFVLELQRKYESSINDLLRKDNKQWTLRSVTIIDSHVFVIYF
jgi:hypothetical protein